MSSEKNDDKKSTDTDNEDSIQYEFQFLTETDANKNKTWYKVKNIFNYEDEEALLNDLGGKEKNIIRNLIKLFTVLKKKDAENKIYNSFVIKGNSVDDVLDIFVRVNSGGTILSKTDLLFSTIVSKWAKAREEIDELIKNINNVGEKYKFNNDFIMRTCLFLLDETISLKVENLKKGVRNIKENWIKISESIRKTVDLFNDLGFCDDNIVSYNAIIPIIYYIFKGGNTNNKNKMNIKKYFVLSQIKRIFGTASNDALTSIRDIIKNNYNDFPFNKLKEIKFTGNRTMQCNKEDIENFIEDEEKNKYTFLLLSLLYENIKYSQVHFHQDHMHAYAFFQDKQIKNLELEDKTTKIKTKISKEKIEDWQRKRNKLPNLQILEGKENSSKNKKPLKFWLKEQNEKIIKYLPNIPYDDDFYELHNFDKFYETRKKIMLNKLNEILL